MGSMVQNHLILNKWTRKGPKAIFKDLVELLVGHCEDQIH
jgi:hypothetical protein